MALVTLRAFRDIVDAELTKARLESEGIRAFVFDENVAGIQWLYSFAIGGVKVKVEEADLAAAREALDTSSLDLDAIEGQEGPLATDGCPACGSLQIGTSRVHRITGAAALLTEVPFVVPRWRWQCRACGHTWRGDRSPVAAETLAAERLVHEEHSHSFLRTFFAILVVVVALLYLREWLRT